MSLSGFVEVLCLVTSCSNFRESSPFFRSKKIKPRYKALKECFSKFNISIYESPRDHVGNVGFLIP